MNDIDTAAYVHSLETERVALKVTVAELEEQLANARAAIAQAAPAERNAQQAAQLIEPDLRRLDASVTPTTREEGLAYEILRPAPWHRSPLQHVALLVAQYREDICDDLEQVARRVTPECAAEIRGAIARLRGERERNHG